jgi:hypothetical protein
MVCPTTRDVVGLGDSAPLFECARGQALLGGAWVAEAEAGSALAGCSWSCGESVWGSVSRCRYFVFVLWWCVFLWCLVLCGVFLQPVMVMGVFWWISVPFWALKRVGIVSFWPQKS